MGKENNKKIEELDKQICVFLEDAGVPADKIANLTERIKKIETQKDNLSSFSEEEAKSISKRIELSLNQERVENRIIKAIEEIKLEPRITVETPKVNVNNPEPKVIIRDPKPVIKVSPPEVKVNTAEVNFPKEMNVKGFGRLLAIFKEKLDVGLEAITRKNPLPVTLVYDEKTYKATGGKEGGMVMGGGPSRIYLKNVDNETSQMVEEVGSPIVYNVTINAPDTEYSQALPEGTRKVKIKMRELTAPLKFAWVTGESGTNYITIPYGATYPMEGIKLSGKTLYFQTEKTSTPYTVEIEAWTK